MGLGGSMYYASIGIISIIVISVVNFEALRKVTGPRASKVRTMYRCFLFSLLAYLLTDSMWGIFYDLRWETVTYIDTMLDFSAMALSVVFWVQSVVLFTGSTSRFTKIFLFAGWFILLFEVIILSVNLFIPIVFAFTENGEYLTLLARDIALFIQMALFLSSSAYAFFIASKSKGIKRIHYMTVGFSGIIMAVFIVLQIFSPFMPFYALGCLFATCVIHSFIYREKDIEHDREMEDAQRKAFRDGLTGVKNKLAYLESLRDLEMQAGKNSFEGYGVVVFDLNGLKEINDTLGHETGDEHIKSASSLICSFYKHSPVYRIGGDEFVVILKGSDFDDRENIKMLFDRQIDENQRNGAVVVSSGMAVFDSAVDESYTEVFIRADRKMYERKTALKARGR